MPGDHLQGFPGDGHDAPLTSASDGEADRQGAVGVGLCLRTGRALQAVVWQPAALPPGHRPGSLRSERCPTGTPCSTWRPLLRDVGLGHPGTDMVLDSSAAPCCWSSTPVRALPSDRQRSRLLTSRPSEKLGQVKMNDGQAGQLRQDHFGIFDEWSTPSAKTRPQRFLNNTTGRITSRSVTSMAAPLMAQHRVSSDNGDQPSVQATPCA